MVAQENSEDAGDAEDGALLRGSLVEPAAFEPLVLRHSAGLHGYLARRAPGACDDLLAEVWLRAFEGRDGFDPSRGTPRAWLFGVARNVLAAHWQAAGRPTPYDLADAAPADPWQAVDQRIDASAVAPLIRAALRELPDVERELLLLVVWEQLTPAEAAAVVGVPQGTARSRLHRARTRLRDALQRTSAPHGDHAYGPDHPHDPGHSHHPNHSHGATGALA